MPAERIACSPRSVSSYARQHRQVGFLLLVRDGDVVERPALFLGEHLQDVAGGNAAERIEPVLGEMQFVAQGDQLPRPPVQRHGVGKRAVAVEDESFDVRRECHVFGALSGWRRLPVL